MSYLSQPWPLHLTRRSGILLVLAVVGLLAVIYQTDVPVSQWAQAWPQPVRDFFFVITDVGKSDWILIPALALLLITGGLALAVPKSPGKRALGDVAGLSAFVFIGVGLPGLASNLIKRLVGRGRPELFDQVGPLDFQNFFNEVAYQSFPSGHATTAFALCFVVSFLQPRLLPLMLAVAVAIGFSRIVVGVHYPTDVFGGILVGIFGAYLVRSLFASRGWVFERHPDGTIHRRELTGIMELLRRKAD